MIAYIVQQLSHHPEERSQSLWTEKPNSFELYSWSLPSLVLRWKSTFTTLDHEKRKLYANNLYQETKILISGSLELSSFLDFSFCLSYNQKVDDELRIRELSCGPSGSETILMKRNGFLPLTLLSFGTSEIHL